MMFDHDGPDAMPYGSSDEMMAYVQPPQGVRRMERKVIRHRKLRELHGRPFAEWRKARETGRKMERPTGARTASSMA